MVLVAYAEGRLQLAARSAIERHLQECRACRTETQEITMLFSMPLFDDVRCVAIDLDRLKRGLAVTVLDDTDLIIRLSAATGGPLTVNVRRKDGPAVGAQVAIELIDASGRRTTWAWTETDPGGKAVLPRPVVSGVRTELCLALSSQFAAPATTIH